MIQVKNVTKSVLGEPLFEKVSFTLHPGDKVGVVGPNGCGKSTLLKMILGEVEYDEGKIVTEGERIGYLSQNPSADSPALSGGEKTKAALTALFETRFTSLLLDEPTNHLDVANMAWLEGKIREFKGAVLIVSHDRRLLDNCVNRILEIDSDNHTFSEYHGNYSVYRSEKKDQLERQERDHKRQQKQKRKMELWLALKKQEAHAHPDPRKGKQIRAMERRLEREIYSQEIKKPKIHRKFSADFGGEAASPKLIVRTTDITKDFHNKRLLWEVSLDLRGKDRAVLTGANGSGKTTFLKILMGDILPDSGEVRWGSGVRVGYFSQEHEYLDPKKTVLEEFLATDRLKLKGEPRAVLGSFLFKDQNVFKKVSQLSFGERVRLVFAKLTQQENEFLVLDEPTNHLDIPSREVIEEALRNYEGALLAVSHDRYFIDNIEPNRILHIENRVLREE